MSDNDLIRRCDAVDAAWEASSLELFTLGPGKIVARINAIPAVQPTVSPDVAALVEALEWYISEDETNEGDEPMPDHGNRSWSEINSYWIEGKRKAEAALARVKGESK